MTLHFPICGHCDVTFSLEPPRDPIYREIGHLDGALTKPLHMGTVLVPFLPLRLWGFLGFLAISRISDSV